MEGIQFIVDDKGQKTAVVINLQKWGKQWNLFYQSLLNQSNDKETWLNETDFAEKLDRALEWGFNNPPQQSNLDELEKKLNNNHDHDSAYK